MYPGFSFDVGPKATKLDLLRPRGAYLVGRDKSTGEVIAGAGVKMLETHIAEIKRMFVIKTHRGRGLGKELLEQLIATAQSLGAQTVRLDTGVKQVKAIRLYERAGFLKIEDYNGNPFASHWFEKKLQNEATHKNNIENTKSIKQ